MSPGSKVGDVCGRPGVGTLYRAYSRHRDDISSRRVTVVNVHLAGSKFADRVFVPRAETRETILGWFRERTKPGGFVTGAIVPAADDLDTVREDLSRLGLQAYANVLGDTFGGHPEGPHPDPSHPFLEIARVLALKAPCCHLIKPDIQGSVQVTPPPPSQRPVWRWLEVGECTLNGGSRAC